MFKSKKKAIIIGASSGIGEALAKVLGCNGYAVGLAARRMELLQRLQKEIPTQTYVKRIDLTQPQEAISLLRELINELGGMDLIVLNSGINIHNINLAWEQESNIIDVNVLGFVAMSCAAVNYFLTQGSGHIVGISSIAGLRGSASCPAYSASKAFVSNYLEGLRYRLSRSKIYVTDIRPGFVDTALIRGRNGLFWVAQPGQAAEQIYRAIRNKEKVAYITRRWGMIAWIMRALPGWIYSVRYKQEGRDVSGEPTNSCIL